MGVEVCVNGDQEADDEEPARGRIGAPGWLGEIARENGRKGGLKTAENREHMAEIGRRGGWSHRKKADANAKGGEP